MVPKMQEIVKVEIVIGRSEEETVVDQLIINETYLYQFFRIIKSFLHSK